MLLPNLNTFDNLRTLPCTFTAICTVMEIHRRSHLFLFCRPPQVYCIDPKANQISVQPSQIDISNDDLKKTGIIENARSISYDVVSDLKKSLDAGNPVLLEIDLFFQSNRPRSYDGQHSPHTILVSGYDLVKDIFYIIDDINSDYNRIICELPASDLHKAYESYLSLFQTGESASYREYFLRDSFFNHKYASSTPIHSFQKIFRKVYHDGSSMITNGIALIDIGKSICTEVLLDEETLTERVGVLNDRFTLACRARRFHRFTVASLFSKQVDLQVLLNDIYESWYYIRKVLMKFRMTKVYKKPVMERCVEQFDCIKGLEIKAHTRMMEILETKS
jgi:hypothetical protein